jgi:general secretion pathway protein D
VKFSFASEDIRKVIEAYSKVSKQKFVVDSGVRGVVTITGSDDVSVEEAFNLLSSSLAVNGYAISKQGDMMLVKNARNIQRDLIEMHTTLPALKPERMLTYILTIKNIPVSLINRELRILPSKDGEMSVFSPRNQLIISDWASNIHRIDALIKQLDLPLDPKLTKVIEEGKKSDRESQARRAREPHDLAPPMKPPVPRPSGLPEPRTKRLPLDPPASGQ